MEQPLQLCTFYVGDLFFGIEVEHVQEIIRPQEMTHVPLADATIRGLINLRGQIVTAVDMRERLGFSNKEADEFTVNVIVWNQGEATSLFVDRVGDVLDVAPEDFELPPETLSAHTRHLVRGVYKLQSELLLLLDTGRAAGGIAMDVAA